MTLSPGDSAVPFASTDINGCRVSLDQFRGRFVLRAHDGHDIGDHLAVAEIESAIG